jgi:hypothetical protein
VRNWIAVLLAWLCLATSAFAENRIALVIGNDRYDNLSEAQQLHNAVNDARAMKTALERLNFRVDIGENLDRRQFIDKLSEFSAHLQSGDIAFFFYSGHGVSFSGANYMLPRDIPAPRTGGPAEEKRLAALAVAENDALDDIRASEARVTVMALDACRDNPLTPPGGKSLGGARGLQPPTPSNGQLTIYSAGVGQTASDLGEGNSLFTGILVKELTTPGLGLRELAFKTQGEVAALAREHGLMQQPGVYSQIIGDDVYLFGPPKTPSASAEDLGRMIDVATNADFLATLIAGLPDGPMKDRAKARMAELKKTQVALPTEPPKSAPTFIGAAVPQIIERLRYVLPYRAAVVPQLGHSDLVEAVAFSPDGRFIVSGSYDKTLKLWDAATGALLKTFMPKTFQGHDRPVYSVAFSPDGRFIVSGSENGTLELWDAASGREVWTLQWLSVVYSVAFSPDGRTLAGSQYHTIKLWDASGREMRTLQGHTGLVYSVVFSPDGRTIASGSEDYTIKLWDAATGALLKTFPGHGESVRSVAFSPDGRFIVSGSEDKTLKLWDAASGALLKTFPGHDKSVRSVAFSPDGRFIVSGSEDGTLKLWDAANGALLATDFVVDGHGVAYTPDDRFVTDGDPHAAFALVQGLHLLPLDDFIAANRRNTLAGEIARSQASKAR